MKTTMRYHYTPTRRTEKRLTIPSEGHKGKKYSCFSATVLLTPARGNGGSVRGTVYSSAFCQRFTCSDSVSLPLSDLYVSRIILCSSVLFFLVRHCSQFIHAVYKATISLVFLVVNSQNLIPPYDTIFTYTTTYAFQRSPSACCQISDIINKTTRNIPPQDLFTCLTLKCILQNNFTNTDTPAFFRLVFS